jgi:uncharacterized membrane protein
MVPVRSVIAGHARLFIAIGIGLAALALVPRGFSDRTRAIIAWDIGSAFYLAMVAVLFLRSPPSAMEANAEKQEDGEWTLFWLVVAGATVSFAAILGEFGSMKDAPAGAKELKILLVAATLMLSWLLTQVVFALRYAHEYYSRREGAPSLDKGLEFPGEEFPDYWDFVYFSIVLGMTFQVSDVQITSRKLRRLATLHGLLGFLFNTVIIALTVNLASGLL